MTLSSAQQDGVLKEGMFATKTTSNYNLKNKK